MKEYDRFVKSLAQSLQAFSQLMEAVGENLEKNLELPKVTKPAKPVKAARPAPRVTEPAKATKPAKRGRPARRVTAVKAAQSPVEPEKPTVKLRKKRAVPEGAGVVDTVMKVIESSPAGIGLASLKKKTGFNDRQVQNSVYRLKKAGKITTAEKGVYIPVVIPEVVHEEPAPIREAVEAEV